MAGSNIRRRFAELRLPRFSPPLGLWSVLAVGQYAISFYVLRWLFSQAATGPLRTLGFVLIIGLLLMNASWNAVFFRLRDLRASLLLFIPYDVMAVLLGYTLFALDSPTAPWFTVYVAYLVFATTWGFNIWRLNSSSKCLECLNL
jgi:tryptophan-rich sensory protein